MRRYIFQILFSLGVVLAFASRAGAGTVQYDLGEQDFADGKTPVYSREIKAAGVGEAYPFDGTIFGNDLKPNLGAFAYSHSLPLVGVGKPVSAMLVIGLIDIDSTPEHAMDTIAIAFDGVTQPTAMLMGASASKKRSSVEVIEIPVPIDLLADGMLDVSVSAKGPGFGNLGNAIEPDFSRLVVQTDDGIILPPDPAPVPPDDTGPTPQPIPLPPVFLPAGLTLIGVAAMPKKRLRRWLKL